jgi:small subunit ribosomal protein S6
LANLYEIITIISPAENEDGVEAIIGGLRQQLDASGAEVLHVDKWGRRKLAYPIQKHEEGHYVLIHAEGGANVPGEFRAHTKIRESIIREMVIRLEDAQAEATRKQLAEVGPDDAEEVAAQLAAAEQRLADKRAALASGATPAEAQAIVTSDLPEGVTEAAVIEAAADAVEAEVEVVEEVVEVEASGEDEDEDEDRKNAGEEE